MTTRPSVAVVVAGAMLAGSVGAIVARGHGQPVASTDAVVPVAAAPPAPFVPPVAPPTLDAAGLALIDADALYAAVSDENERQALAYLSDLRAAERRRQAAERRRQATPAPQPAVRTGGPCGGWRNLIAAHFPASQVDNACRVMLCESNGNPSAKNPSSSASGLFQIMWRLWRPDYVRVTGVDTPFDPSANVRFAAWLHARSGWSPWVCR